MKKTIATFILIFNLNYIEADDYVWGEEFKEGDVISAATFNQIFDTLQKLNRTPVDADLVGTWSCDSVHSVSGGLDTTGWVANEFLLTLTNAQLTMTASSESTSLAEAYLFSTSNPSPFIRLGTNTAASGTYKLFKNMLLMQGIMSASAISKYQLDVVSNDRFVLTPLSDGGNYPDLIICDSAIAVPAAPTSITATNAQTTVNVTWTDQSSDETGFKIYRRLSTETEAIELATAVAASPYVDSTLTEGQTAYYSVSAYNANGESAKSKVVTATLDSIAPTLVSTSPANGDDIATDDRQLTLTFNEKVEVFCPSDPSAGYGCATDARAVTGNWLDDRGKERTFSIGTINSGFGGSLTISGSMMGSAELFGANQSVTATVNKAVIRDVNGNVMESDYEFTFTVNNTQNNSNCPPNC